MQYSITIRNNATGEIRTRHMDLEWNDVGTEWWLTEGNFGCDCNRYLEFERAGGHEPYHEGTVDDCGYTAYTIICATLENGEVILID